MPTLNTLTAPGGILTIAGLGAATAATLTVFPALTNGIPSGTPVYGPTAQTPVSGATVFTTGLANGAYYGALTGAVGGQVSPPYYFALHIEPGASHPDIDAPVLVLNQSGGTTFSMGQGDTGALEGTLLDGAEALTNISVQSAIFTMRRIGASAASVNAAASLTSDGTGTTFSYQWQPGDTATPGKYLGQLTLTYPDGTQQTFPDSDCLEITILPALA